MPKGPKPGTRAFGERAKKRRDANLAKMTPAQRKRHGADVAVTDVVSGKKTSFRKRQKAYDWTNQ